MLSIWTSLEFCHLVKSKKKKLSVTSSFPCLSVKELFLYLSIVFGSLQMLSIWTSLGFCHLVKTEKKKLPATSSFPGLSVQRLIHI